MKVNHIPVLLQPACNLLDPRPGKSYIDATFGGGGHALEILHRGGRVLGLDQDAEALQPALALAGSYPALKVVKGNFMFLEDIAGRYGFNPVDGIIFDLGMSSMQLGQPDRGFSFQTPGPLDMRMDRDSAVTAAQLINTLSEKDLVQILTDFGELASARSIVRQIIAARPLNTTTELSRILKNDSERRRVFQAFRIAVNAEIMAIETALPQALALLRPGGRLAVISFHSLEDRVVKTLFHTWQTTGMGQILTPKPIVPGLEEIQVNPRSKSSKLRAFKKND